MGEVQLEIFNAMFETVKKKCKDEQRRIGT